MIRIVTESMSDFTQEEAKAADLIVMPLPIRFGMEEYWDDGVSLTQDDFYARLRVAKELPKTSQVPVEHYRKCFNRLLENPEDEVLVITGSSKLSGCYQSACIAREACHDPARVTVLDSLNATCAEYMLVDQALRYRREGVSDMPTMLAKLRDVMAHYKIIGMAADLKYLVMGGRLSPLVGKLGNRLSIKPTLKIEDGIVSKAGMVHGMAKGRAWYIEQLKECPPDPDVPVYIGGADCPETVALIKSQIEAANLGIQDIRCVKIGCLIGTYVGPELTLVAWKRKSKRQLSPNRGKAAVSLSESAQRNVQIHRHMCICPLRQRILLRCRQIVIQWRHAHEIAP